MEERIRKVYVSNLRPGEKVQTVFKVTEKVRHTSRSGQVFLSIILTDKTGHVDARIFSQVDQLEPTFQAGDYALVEGTVTAFKGKPQVVVEKIERLDPEPIQADEFTPALSPASSSIEATAGRGVGGISSLLDLADTVHSGPIRDLLKSLLADENIKRLAAADASRILTRAKAASRLSDTLHPSEGVAVAGTVLQELGLAWAKLQLKEKSSQLSDFPPATAEQVRNYLVHPMGTHLELGAGKPTRSRDLGKGRNRNRREKRDKSDNSGAHPASPGPALPAFKPLSELAPES